MPRKKTPIPQDLLDLRRRLADWRSAHPQRSRLPEELWQAAVELARRYGLHRTARALPVHYPTLRRGMGGKPKRRAAMRPAEFVELIASAPPGACVVEMWRVPMTGGLDWSQLLRAWRQAQG